MIERKMKRVIPYTYFVFRVLVGLLFAVHGAQKLFGILGGKAAVPLLSLMGVAGIVELVGGLMVALGVLTRPAAGVSAVQMLVAYFMAHFPNGWNPLTNRGEASLLFFSAFLVIATLGSKKWGLEKAVRGKELV